MQRFLQGIQTDDKEVKIKLPNPMVYTNQHIILEAAKLLSKVTLPTYPPESSVCKLPFTSSLTLDIVRLLDVCQSDGEK